MVKALPRTSEMLMRDSDLWAAGQVASGPQDQFAGRAGRTRRPYGRHPLEIVVERAAMASPRLERCGANWTGLPDLHMPGLFVNDHLGADARDQSRCVVAPAAAYVDPAFVKARECDKSHVDALNLVTAVPLKATAEICQDRLLNRSVISESRAVCQGGEHGGGEAVRPYAFFELDAHHDLVAAPR